MSECSGAQWSCEDQTMEDDSNNRIVTAVRIRPFSTEELEGKRNAVARLGPAKGDIVILNPTFFESTDQSATKRELSERVFSYDHSFHSANSPATSDQADIYKRVGFPIVQTCLDGVNCSLFAYGGCSACLSIIVYLYTKLLTYHLPDCECCILCYTMQAKLDQEKLSP